jgi:molybdenum cofactor cytidylyltransferase
MRSFAIIPAAGKSGRMGTPKLLLPWRGRTVIECVLEAWQQGGVSYCVVVVAADDRRLIELCELAGATVVQPAKRPAEMRDSIALGLQFIQQQWQPTDVEPWLVAPADMPELPAALIAALLQQFDSTGEILVPQSPLGEAGHPICLPWRLADEYLRFTGTLREFIHRHKTHPLPWSLDDTIADLDTPADYLRLQNRHNPTQN